MKNTSGNMAPKEKQSSKSIGQRIADILDQHQLLIPFSRERTFEETKSLVASLIDKEGQEEKEVCDLALIQKLRDETPPTRSVPSRETGISTAAKRIWEEVILPDNGSKTELQIITTIARIIRETSCQDQ